MNLSGIRNIIFDFGGVILNIDYHLTENEFVKLGLSDFSSLYTQFSQNNLFDLLEIGRIEPDAFRAEIKKQLPDSTTVEQIDAAWNAMLLDHPKERLELLQVLKPQFRTFMLSNTNAIHYDAFLNILWNEHKVNGLDAYFEKVYYSHCIHKRKPNVETFEWVLKENNLNPAETLFIDDSPQHIEGAQKAGLHTYHLTKGEEITELFSDFLAQLHQ